MQFAVPQFTEIDDRLIGSLTLKQFLVLLAAGGLILFMWSILGPSIPFFVLSLPVAVVAVAASLGKYNGRPAFTYLMPFMAFLSSQRTRVFKREAGVIMVSKAQVDAPKSKSRAQTQVDGLETADDPSESTESRLKKLAYLLDSKEKQQGEIIGGDTGGVIQKPDSHAQIDLSGFIKKAKTEAASFMPKSAPAKPVASKASAAPPSAPPTPAKKKFDPSSFLEK